MGADLAEDGETQLAWNTFDLDSIDPNVVRIYGLDITINNSITELDWTSFTQRNRFASAQQGLGPPLSYCVYDETKLALQPISNQAYNMVLWYLPEYPEITKDDDEFNPQIPGADEWVVWDALQKIAVRDNYGPLSNMAQRYKDQFMSEVNHHITSASRTGPGRRLNTRQRRINKSSYRFFDGLSNSGR